MPPTKIHVSECSDISPVPWARPETVILIDVAENSTRAKVQQAHAVHDVEASTAILILDSAGYYC
jgi:hypothetical protein